MSWPTINPSELRHQVTFQSPSVSRDSFGQPTSAWVNVVTLWAKICTVTARELFQSNQLASNVTHTITTRYTSHPLVAGMRVTFGSHVYLIQGIDNVELRNMFLKCLVLEVNGNA